MAFIMVLSMMLSSISLMNFRMKQVNRQSQTNFYTAETAIDEIRAGLVEDISEASASAYEYVMSRYSTYGDADAREESFAEKFVDVMIQDVLKPTSDGSTYYYDTTYLYAKLKKMDTPRTVVTTTNTDPTARTNILNRYQDKVVLKNVIVQYTDEQDYFTEIKTDIELTAPDMGFVDMPSAAAKSLDLLSYTLIAQNSAHIATGSNVTVEGSCYAGDKGLEVCESAVVKMKKKASASGVNLIMKGDLNAQSFTDVDLSDVTFWGRNINVKNKFLASHTTLNLSNDLQLFKGAKVTVDGALYAYGNYASAKGTECNDYIKADIEAHPSNYSSSILINGVDTLLDLTGLSDLWLCGNAYVEFPLSSYEESLKYSGVTYENNNDVIMGESLSIRSDQMAYLVPAELIAPDSSSGGMNPLTKSQYEQIVAEGVEIVDTDKEIKTGAFRGKKLYELTGYDHDVGGKCYQTQFKQVILRNNVPDSMIYIFMVFNSATAQKQAMEANSYFRDYYGKESNGAGDADARDKKHYQSQNRKSGAANLDVYSDGIRLPVSANTYYNGNILMYTGSSANVFEYIEDNRDAAAHAPEEKKKQETFTALNINLTDTYTDDLKTKKRDVFFNLVNITKIAADIPTNGAKEYRNPDTGELEAVVANGAYTIQEPSVHAVIAMGDVVIDTSQVSDYRGIIISNGVITAGQSGMTATVTADATLAATALSANGADGSYPIDYLYNGKYYIGNTGTTEGEIGAAALYSCVRYKNWTKQ